MNLKDELSLITSTEASSKGLSRDMSPEAIARRIEIASELRDLARILSTTKRLGKADPLSGDAGDRARDPRSVDRGSGE